MRFSVRFVLTAATAVASIVSFTSPALADDSGFYVGANVGRVLSTYRRADLDNGLSKILTGGGSTFALGTSSVEKDRVMWSADVGYLLSRNFAIEGSYLNLGSLRYSAFGNQTFNGASSAVTAQVETKSHGPALALLGILPMTDIWEVHARFGAYQGKTTSTFSSTNGPNSAHGQKSETSTSVLAGVGTAVTISSHYLIRFDYIRLQRLKEKAFNKSFNVDLVTAGVAYVF